MKKRKIPKYIDNIPKADKLRRLVWRIISLFLFKPFSLPFFNKWRVFLLKCFGAKIGKYSKIYSSAYIPSPWNLKMGTHSTLGPDVKLHIGETIIGNKVSISQRTYLCSATHNINSINLPFLTGKIVINDFVWVGAEAFIMANITVGEGAVIGARSVIVKDVDPWFVVGGNPARFIKKREIKESN